MENRDGPHASPHGSLIVYRCPACKTFVAASRDPKLIELAKGSHACPESLAFSTQDETPPSDR